MGPNPVFLYVTPLRSLLLFYIRFTMTKKKFSSDTELLRFVKVIILLRGINLFGESSEEGLSILRSPKGRLL